MINAKSPSERVYEFQGFEPLSASFVFAPNQFFDLIMPNHSRPVVRLVAYIMHQTLRWLDDNGSPVQQHIAVPFKTLINEARISRGSISKAIQTAIESNLIECVQAGRKKKAGDSGKSAVYSLRWDKTGNYAKDICSFQGFYVGEGNRTPIPHSFFSQVLPAEPLAVSKVVATVFRHTVGYQNQYGGGRRLDAPLSFTKIRDYANIGGSASVAVAIQDAIRKKYIVRLRRGTFSPDIKQQAASVYGIKWLENSKVGSIGSKSEPEDWYKNESRGSVQNSKQQEFKNQTRIGPEIESADRFKNCSTKKETTKRNNKQKTFDVGNETSVSLLRDVGFNQKAAVDIACQSSAEVIERQIKWLKHRKPESNPLGMLRIAIENDWCEPDSLKQKQLLEKQRTEQDRQETAARIENQKQAEQRRQDHARWFKMDRSIRERCKQAALEQETNLIVRRHMQNKTIDDPPHAAFLIHLKKLNNNPGEHNSCSKNNAV